MKINRILMSRISLFLLAVLTVCSALFVAPSVVPAQVRVGVTFQNYVPPSWAPPYDNVSSTEYYYFPDYEMYYDVWTGEFWYLNGADWAYSIGPPPMYAGIDLNSSYIVLIDRHVHNPWFNHSFYTRNYPRHSYDNYQNIVVKNRIVTNIQPNHELIPRAYNENNRRVTFMQHPVGGQPPVAYHRVAHEVPIRAIAPSMPKASRSFNYGGASNRGGNGHAAPPARAAAPSRAAAPARGGGAPSGGGGAHGGGGGNQKH